MLTSSRCSWNALDCVLILVRACMYVGTLRQISDVSISVLMVPNGVLMLNGWALECVQLTTPGAACSSLVVVGSRPLLGVVKGWVGDWPFANTFGL